MKPPQAVVRVAIPNKAALVSSLSFLVGIIMIPYDMRCLTEVIVLTQRWLVSQLKFKKLADKSPLFWAGLIGLGSVFSFF